MLIFSQNYYFCKIIEFLKETKVRGKAVSVLQIPKKPVESLERMKYTEFVIEAATESQREMLIAELSDYPFDGFTEEEDCLKAYISEADFRMWRSAIEESLERNRCRYTVAEVPDRNWNTVWESISSRSSRRTLPDTRSFPFEKSRLRVRCGDYAENVVRHGSSCDHLSDGGRNYGCRFYRKIGTGYGKRHRGAFHSGRETGSRTGRCRRYRRVGISQRDREYKGQRNGRTDRPVAGRRVFAGRETLRFRAGQY